MKNNTWTIIKKEFARFFGDRQLLFTTVIMPGLLIYLVYSLMGEGIGKMVTEGQNDVVTVRVENMPQFLATEIAADHHLSPATVRQRIHRIVLKLRTIYKQYYE